MLQRLGDDVQLGCLEFVCGTSDLSCLAAASTQLRALVVSDPVWTAARARREGVLHKAVAFGDYLAAQAERANAVLGYALYRKVVLRRGYQMDDYSIWTAVTMWKRNPTLARSIYGPIEYWDTHGVKSIDLLFNHAYGFNEDISRWDVSNVANMHGTFYDAVDFDGDISDWEVSSVADMSYMFYNARKFNGDLSKWDVASVVSFRRMFFHAAAFAGDLSAWQTDSAEHMGEMFMDACKFNCGLRGWNVSGVAHMRGMFCNAYEFDGDVSTWDVANVGNMSFMFYNARSFTGNLSSWDVANVVAYADVFTGAESIRPAQLRAYMTNFERSGRTALLRSVADINN